MALGRRTERLEVKLIGLRGLRVAAIVTALVDEISAVALSG
jgi:hypothetical protein